MRKSVKPLILVVCLSLILTPALYASPLNFHRPEYKSFLAEHIMDFAAVFHFIPSVSIPRDQLLPISTIDDVMVTGGLNVVRLGDGD